MIAAYNRLYAEGWAHSIEVWQNDALIGGLYGLAIGRVFFGESMFSRQSNASKYALYALSQYLHIQEFAMIDCQVLSHHLTTLGATRLPRDRFADILKVACEPPAPFGKWPRNALPVRQIETNCGRTALQ